MIVNMISKDDGVFEIFDLNENLIHTAKFDDVSKLYEDIDTNVCFRLYVIKESLVNARIEYV